MLPKDQPSQHQTASEQKLHSSAQDGSAASPDTTVVCPSSGQRQSASCRAAEHATDGTAAGNGNGERNGNGDTTCSDSTGNAGGAAGGAARAAAGARAAGGAAGKADEAAGAAVGAGDSDDADGSEDGARGNCHSGHASFDPVLKRDSFSQWFCVGAQTCQHECLYGDGQVSPVLNCMRRNHLLASEILNGAADTHALNLSAKTFLPPTTIAELKQAAMVAYEWARQMGNYGSGCAVDEDSGTGSGYQHRCYSCSSLPSCSRGQRIMADHPDDDDLWSAMQTIPFAPKNTSSLSSDTRLHISNPAVTVTGTPHEAHVQDSSMGSESGGNIGVSAHSASGAAGSAAMGRPGSTLAGDGTQAAALTDAQGTAIHSSPAIAQVINQMPPEEFIRISTCSLSSRAAGITDSMTPLPTAGSDAEGLEHCRCGNIGIRCAPESHSSREAACVSGAAASSRTVAASEAARDAAAAVAAAGGACDEDLSCSSGCERRASDRWQAGGATGGAGGGSGATGAARGAATGAADGVAGTLSELAGAAAAAAVHSAAMARRSAHLHRRVSPLRVSARARDHVVRQSEYSAWPGVQEQPGWHDRGLHGSSGTAGNGSTGAHGSERHQSPLGGRRTRVSNIDFEPHDFMGLLSSEERAGIDKSNKGLIPDPESQQLASALHYLQLSQAIKITEQLTARSTFSFNIPARSPQTMDALKNGAANESRSPAAPAHGAGTNGATAGATGGGTDGGTGSDAGVGQSGHSHDMQGQFRPGAVRTMGQNDHPDYVPAYTGDDSYQSRLMAAKAIWEAAAPPQARKESTSSAAGSAAADTGADAGAASGSSAQAGAAAAGVPAGAGGGAHAAGFAHELFDKDAALKHASEFDSRAEELNAQRYILQHEKNRAVLDRYTWSDDHSRPHIGSANGNGSSLFNSTDAPQAALSETIFGSRAHTCAQMNVLLRSEPGLAPVVPAAGAPADAAAAAASASATAAAADAPAGVTGGSGASGGTCGTVPDSQGFGSLHSSSLEGMGVAVFDRLRSINAADRAGSAAAAGASGAAASGAPGAGAAGVSGAPGAAGAIAAGTGAAGAGVGAEAPGEAMAGSELELSGSDSENQLRQNLLNLEHSIHVLMSLIGCGVYIQAIGADCQRHLLWGNKGFYDITGYDPAFLMGLEGAEFASKILHPDDVEQYFSTFSQTGDNCQSVSLEYRIRHGRTGEYIWLEVKSAFLGIAGDKGLYMGMITDITEQKLLNDRMARWIRKNELLAEACQEMIFEYDQDDDVLERFGNYQIYVPARESIQPQFLNYLSQQDYMHPEDRDLFEGIFSDRSLRDGHTRRTVKFRMKPQGVEEFQWHELSVIGYTAQSTGHTMLIGKLYSIHEYEMKIADLNHENMLDPMTRLLNKSSMEQQVAQTLLEHPFEHHAVLMIDIDDFKKVNDTHGHAFGDEVIMMIAECLKNAFRSSDLVGRMGGDEFMVMLKNVTVEQASALACLYHEIIQEECLKLSIPYPVSSSVGIAFAPEHGKNYAEIYHSADCALYEVKQLKKGQIALFDFTSPLPMITRPATRSLGNYEERVARLTARMEKQHRAWLQARAEKAAHEERATALASGKALPATDSPATAPSPSQALDSSSEQAAPAPATQADGEHAIEA